MKRLIFSNIAYFATRSESYRQTVLPKLHFNFHVSWKTYLKNNFLFDFIQINFQEGNLKPYTKS